MKLTETEIMEIRKTILKYCCSENNLNGELYSNKDLEKLKKEISNNYLLNYPKTIENGALVEYYLNIGIKRKDKRITEDALFLLNIVSYEVYSSEDILDKLNILLLEEWHFWHENIMNILLNDFKNKKSLDFFKKVAIWNSDTIWDYEEYLHKTAIKGILQIAKKDSIEILESLVGKVDEETAPFLERKIKEAKEIYLDS